MNTGIKALLLGLGMLAPMLVAADQGLDNICGCKGHPKSLGAFDMSDEKTWPAGSVLKDRVLTLPLPPDGVLVFDSFRAVRGEKERDHLYIQFERNAHNTPVTLLVAGDFITSGYRDIRLYGSNGEGGNDRIFGRGGLPGNGGFRGGDGAYQDINDAKQGATGLGPAGGVGGTPDPLENGQSGEFSGGRVLRPLIGGSGGGGGASSQSGNCSGGGGGGGGGAILIAANGRIEINGAINARGGHGGGRSNGECSSYGGPGAGGAIRLVATTVTGEGVLQVEGDDGRNKSKDGIIRIETVEEDSFPPYRAYPRAIRSNVIAPLIDPLPTSIRITTVGGQPVPPKRKSKAYAVEVLLPRPGNTAVQVETRGVPAGTIVEVVMKAKAGGGQLRGREELNPKNCKASGECTAVLNFDLPGGAWYGEATATFQTP